MRQLYFFAYDSAFYWVRNCSLESHLAGAKKIEISKLTQTFTVKDSSILVFNRFALSKFFQFAWKFASKLKIPYVVDIDDLFWDLPNFSSDTAKDSHNLSLVDNLISGAAALVTTNDFLKQKLTERYSKPVYVIANARPNWIAPPSSVLIANTDAFKMEEGDRKWFSEYLAKLIDLGVPFQFLGSPADFLGELEMSCYFQGSLGYYDYLKFINSNSFSSGIIPVGNGEYADCKSAIKIQEYLAAGLNIYASKIAPYVEFNNSYPAEKLKLLENKYEAWSATISEIGERVPEHIRTASKIDAKARLAQLNAWDFLLTDISANIKFPSSAEYYKYRVFMYSYLRILNPFKAMLKRYLSPILRMLGK